MLCRRFRNSFSVFLTILTMVLMSYLCKHAPQTNSTHFCLGHLEKRAMSSFFPCNLGHPRRSGGRRQTLTKLAALFFTFPHGYFGIILRSEEFDMSGSEEWKRGSDEIGLVFVRGKWSPSLTFMHFFEQVKIIMNVFLKILSFFLMLHIFKFIFLFLKSFTEVNWCTMNFTF